MKATITIFILVALFFTQLLYARAGIPLPVGSKKKVIHTMDLPDQKEFQMADGRYFDLGSYYEIDHLLWLAYGHSEPQLIGYLGNSDEYVVLTPKELEAIAKTTKGSSEAEAKASFMDKIGGKILLGMLLLLVLYGLFSSYFLKQPTVNEPETSTYWRTSRSEGPTSRSRGV